MKNLTDFIRLRDSSDAFKKSKERGYPGIPCFHTEDGEIYIGRLQKLYEGMGL